MLVGKDVQVFPVTKLPADQIKDTNGAGDAFVGGMPGLNFNIYMLFIITEIVF